jgi:hypothetical protein
MIRGSQFQGIREKAGLSKLGRSGTRLAHTRNIDFTTEQLHKVDASGGSDTGITSGML